MNQTYDKENVQNILFTNVMLSQRRVYTLGSDNHVLSCLTNSVTRCS